MKLLCIGDLHLTDNRPVNRTDNYWETCKRKLNFIFDIADREFVDVIISPGDLTDTPSLSNIELDQLIYIFKSRLNANFFTTFGQHDLRYRTKPNTALMVLERAMSIDPRLQEEKFVVMDSGRRVFKDELIVFHASGYGEEIPEPMPGNFNILIIHRMIIEEKLWSAQEIYEPSNIFLRHNKFDLIVSGDNHQGFIAQAAGSKRILVNCGAMMRNSIALIDHKPFIVIFDTDTRKYKQVFIPIEPVDKVFRMEKVVTEKARNENLESFISGLSQQKEIGLLFEDNLLQYAKENGIGDDVMTEIYASFENKKGLSYDART